MPVLYSHMAIVECAGESELDELMAAGLQRFAVRRLGPAAVQVDHQRLPEIRKLFERLGQTPRISNE